MATPPSPPPPEQLYLDHLPLIEAVATHAARRYRLTKEETEDFVSTVKLRLLEKDYAKIREFQGRSKFGSYLNIVVNHLLQDYRNHVLGKWRVSTEAKRLGPVACRLDVLLNRELLSFDVAVGILRTNEKVVLSPQELADLAGRLPPHPPRQIYGEEELEGRTAEAENPEERMLGLEAARRKKVMLARLRLALKDLPDEDRLIALMRARGFTVVQIANALHLEQKPPYHRIEKIFRTVRANLERQGVSAGDIREILALSEHDPDD